ncbi:hypothetical protein PRIPAC_71764 [Pristionchus pacificus]|uniref:Nuclear pore complex protein Nup107 n=1 Tax=Pristionchus pacificus TaxID=54126 RepID=A0A2A6BFN4_PRIPA|nr:hypothetical protein PRIPAC_71764 [Pristionchus pacificus]|eukprot:PDM64673.1 hypothetical protein PRIPAC_52929 [Pristionchus pacificus]
MRFAPMSTSDNYVFDDSRGFSDDETSSDGYGGVHPRLYDAIVTYIREGIYPEFCILRSNESTNAYFHWKNRCKRFRLTDTGILLYTANNPSTARAVVRLGEVRLAIRFIHEKIGHTGAKYTYDMCARRLYWRSMRRDIYRYVAECEFCKSKKEIKRSDLPLNQIGCPPSHCSSPEEIGEMQELVDRLLLNNDDDLNGELPYYKEDEINEPVYEEMEGEQFYTLERDETDALSSMCGSAYLVALREGRIGKNPHSSLYDDDEEEERNEQTTSIIVSDDVIHPVSNEIMSGKSPCLGLDRSVPSPSEEEGLRMEEREKEQVRIMMERRDDDRRRRGDGNGRKRRLGGPSSIFDPTVPIDQRGNPNNMTKKRLLEENKVLRARLSVLEKMQSEERTNMAMQMPPSDRETADMQKNLLHMQREVLMMQRTYWQAKLNNEGFQVQMEDYYDESAAGDALLEEHPSSKYEVVDGVGGDMQLHLHYENEMVEIEGLDDHGIIEEDSLIDN